MRFVIICCDAITTLHRSHCSTHLDDRGRGREQSGVPEIIDPHGGTHDNELERLYGLSVLCPVLQGDLGPLRKLCDRLGAADRECSDRREGEQHQDRAQINTN